MLNSLRFLARRMVLGIADYLVTAPVIRWTWTGPSGDDLVGTLGEFRPADHETVLEMMQGRYLLDSKLVDTHGLSPFGMDVVHADWLTALQGFAWLRHFRDARSEEERRFARTLTLDWIGRVGSFDRTTWAPALCARRVVNWLRHLNILIEGASPEQATIIMRSLRTQIQSLKIRGRLTADPLDALLAAVALVGVELCTTGGEDAISGRLGRVHQLLNQQIDADGLHRSRSAAVQLQLLIELITMQQAMGQGYERFANEFTAVLERMQRALDAISLGTGEPAYFNGTGQLPHDLVVAVQSQSLARARESCLVGGYGRLLAGRAVVVADSGLVSEPVFSAHAHASALAFEFSHESDLVVGNCGPTPSGMDAGEFLFRQGVAHSAPTINAASAANIAARGALAGRLVAIGRPGEMELDAEEPSLLLRCHGYEDRFGVTLERRLTLLAEGKTLVGQERLIRHGKKMSGACAIRFHLAQQTEVQDGGDLLRLRLASGAIWTFLWEGAQVRVEDSVRQSAYFGFHRTKQIVLDLLVADASDVSWIFTLDEA